MTPEEAQQKTAYDELLDVAGEYGFLTDHVKELLWSAAQGIVFDEDL